MANKTNGERGQALILVCMVIVFLTILIAPLFNIILSERSMLDRMRLQKEAFYFAEGGMEEAISKFVSDVNNFRVAAAPQNYQWNTVYANSAAFPQGAQVNSAINAIDAGQSFGELFEENYIVASTCVHPANHNIIVTLNRVITLEETAAFQYGVFYNNTLELSPGAPMTLTGKIHSNSDIYIVSNGSTLTINSDYLCSAGNIYNKQKYYNYGQHDSGAVNILVDGSDQLYNNMHTSGTNGGPLDCNDPNWSAYSQDSAHGWNGAVKNAVPKIAVPTFGSLASGGGAFYADNAGLKIIGAVITRNGAILNPGVDVPNGTVTMAGLYDYRERGAIITVNIDLKKLAGYSGAVDANGNPVRDFNNNLPLNGLIYAAYSDGDPQWGTAVRLVNGSTIYAGDVYAGTNADGTVKTADAGGLTVATNLPVYVQGNYNTADTYPAAVICDSLDILSNSWSDNYNSGTTLSGRLATDTTINAALVAGVDSETATYYNGGFNNFPRLLEDWKGTNLNITGCFTELWNTQVARGQWQDTNGLNGYWYPPARHWSYDTNFDKGGNSLPPFTPHYVQAQRSTWWKQ